MFIILETKTVADEL